MSELTLLTPPEAAKRLRCSQRTLERQRTHGDGPPFIKFGGIVRYPESHFTKWMEERLRRSTSEAA